MAAETHLAYEFDNFQLDPDRRRLSRGGQLIPLPGKAFEILLLLVRNRGRLLTKDELFQLVWPDQIVEESNLTVNMSAIRRALGERANNPHYIRTISGRGYRFTGDVRQFVDEELTIERESFALVVHQEQVETSTVAASLTRLISLVGAHPLLLGVLGAVALMLAMGFLLVRSSFYRSSAATQPWSNVSLHRFATHAGVPFRVAISPDGKSLVYSQRIEGKDTVWLGQIESNSSMQILDKPNVTYNGLTFSPDGQSIYVTEYDSARLLRLPAVGGVPIELSQHVGSPVSFSPDGQQIAFLRPSENQNEIVIADAADGKNERVLINRQRPETFSSSGLSWSPDGRTIAVAAKQSDTGRAQILAIAVADGSTRKIGNRDWGEIGNVKWQGDGGGLLFTERAGALARRSDIWFVSYPQGEARQITNDLNQYLINNLSLSATGIAAVLDGVTESEIWIAPDGDISRARRVLQGITPKYEGVDGLSWTPDGHLLYTAYVGDGQAIWEMNGDGTSRRQLTNAESDSVDRLMTVTADNRYIVFQSDRNGSLQIWRANRDGSDLKQLTSGDQNIQPTLTPDSKSIIYVSTGPDGPTLWRMSIEGVAKIQLTHNHSSSPQVSPDGTLIAYLASSRSDPLHLAIVPLNGGPEKSFGLPERPGPNLAKKMCWTPDGKGIIYKDTMQGLWRQRLDEAKPQLLPGFEGIQVAQLRWSINGKGLAFTRVANMQEIVLMRDPG